jgi:hypothetical protein
LTEQGLLLPDTVCVDPPLEELVRADLVYRG